jgi:hypothetical protein
MNNVQTLGRDYYLWLCGAWITCGHTTVMSKFMEEAAKRRWKSRFVTQIHDELVLKGEPSEVSEIVAFWNSLTDDARVKAKHFVLNAGEIATHETLFKQFSTSKKAEEPEGSKQCAFKITRTLQCHRNVREEDMYCSEHKPVKCQCGCKATHYCYEKRGCKLPLCDENPYCTHNHNINKHMGW